MGTDGILLGAWASVAGVQSVLDVGTGSGLIALMLAQRTEAVDPACADRCRIDAVEIEFEAAEQAEGNVANSPWPNRICVHNQPYEIFREIAIRQQKRFDLIVSNPPYFQMSIPENSKRRIARSGAGLTVSRLIETASSLLDDDGRLAVILPSNAEAVLLETAACNDLMAARLLRISPLPRTPPNRMLVEFQRTPDDGKANGLTTAIDEFVLETSKHVYSDRFRDLTRGFHLAHI